MGTVYVKPYRKKEGSLVRGYSRAHGASLHASTRLAFTGSASASNRLRNLERATTVRANMLFHKLQAGAKGSPSRRSRTPGAMLHGINVRNANRMMVKFEAGRKRRRAAKLSLLELRY